MRVAGERDDECAFAAKGRNEQAIRSDFGRGVEPCGLISDVGERDDVVESSGRRNIFVEGSVGADQCGVRRNARGGEHGSEQRGLVFAVAVLVGEDVGGFVRLVPANAEGDADVADLRANESVDGAGLLFRRGLAFDQLRDLGLDVVGGFGA